MPIARVRHAMLAAAVLAAAAVPLAADVTFAYPVPKICAESADCAGDAEMVRCSAWPDPFPANGIVLLRCDGERMAEEAAERVAANGLHGRVVVAASPDTVVPVAKRHPEMEFCMVGTKPGAKGTVPIDVLDREIFSAISNRIGYYEAAVPLPDVFSIQMHDSGVKTIGPLPAADDVQAAADMGVKYVVSRDVARTRRALAALKRKMEGPVSRRDFRVRDPFILADADTRTYYSYETTPWNTGRGVNVRTSKDLETWSAPRQVMAMPPEFRTRSVWAPEVHRHNGAYYLFATPTLEPDPRFPIKAMPCDGDSGWAPPKRHALTRRGTWIWKADSPLGPFRPLSDMSATPHDEMALDGTLVVEDGVPWMVYCHEWTQTKVGKMKVARLSDDLSRIVGAPVEVFRADVAFGDGRVTDGPFCWRTKTGKLLMTWSKFANVNGKRAYVVIQCESLSGRVCGPWANHRIICPDNGGHGMIFRAFDGTTKLVLHMPERRGWERMAFLDVNDETDTLVVGRTAK